MLNTSGTTGTPCRFNGLTASTRAFVRQPTDVSANVVISWPEVRFWELGAGNAPFVQRSPAAFIVTSFVRVADDTLGVGEITDSAFQA